jgi:uroporphyrinogen decarboxylase
MSEHLLVRTIRGEVVERPPVWAMRQAGRWDPEFNKLRAGLSFYEFSENVELAARASLCPKRFGVDGIILFYDITSVPVAMGLPFALKTGEGPVPDQPIRTLDDVRRLQADLEPASFQHIRDLLRLVKAELRGELQVLVFAGAPFTVATYCIGTGKNLAATRAFIQERPAVWEELLARLESATVRFLNTLSAEGADVYQLFDSWAGMLTREEYLRWAQPYHQAIFSQARTIPRILFVKEAPYLDLLTQAGAEAVSLGTIHDLAQARRDYPHLVFQGNVDEKILRTGTPELVRQTTRRCVKAGGGQRHIVNLNHGVDRTTPVANFEAYIQAAREMGPVTS